MSNLCFLVAASTGSYNLRGDDNFPGEDEDDSKLTPVEVESELSPDEWQERLYLERLVERTFYEAGKSLQKLRDKKLYRNTHPNFEEYCRDRFGHSRQKSNYLIAAADVYDNLTTSGCQNSGDSLTTNGCQILPTNERQVRPLSKLSPHQQVEAWELSIKLALNKQPSNRIVQDVVQRIMERTKAANPYRVGEVCQFLPKNNPDLRGKGKCWCIITAVNEFSCTVTTLDGDYTIRIDHLKSFNYFDSDCCFMQELSTRIKKLYNNENLETAEEAVLKHLSELNRPYLTPLEEKLLSLLEKNGSN